MVDDEPQGVVYDLEQGLNAFAAQSEQAIQAIEALVGEYGEPAPHRPHNFVKTFAPARAWAGDFTREALGADPLAAPTKATIPPVMRAESLEWLYEHVATEDRVAVWRNFFARCGVPQELDQAMRQNEALVAAYVEATTFLPFTIGPVLFENDASHMVSIKFPLKFESVLEALTPLVGDVLVFVDTRYATGAWQLATAQARVPRRSTPSIQTSVILSFGQFQLQDAVPVTFRVRAACFAPALLDVDRARVERVLHLASQFGPALFPEPVRTLAPVDDEQLVAPLYLSGAYSFAAADAPLTLQRAPLPSLPQPAPAAEYSVSTF